MKTTNDYLDDLKVLYGLPSDYAMAKKLGVMPANLTNYRKMRTHFDDNMAIKVAELLGIDPAEVLAAMNVERTKCPGARAVWERMARSFSAGAVAIFIAVSMGLAPHIANAQDSHNFAHNVYYVKLHRLRELWINLGFCATLHVLALLAVFLMFGTARADTHTEHVVYKPFVHDSIKTIKKYNGWTRTNTALEGAYMAVLVADWTQTRQIAANPDRWREINPLLDEHPSRQSVDVYFAASALAHYGISRLLPPRYRAAWQITSLVIQSGVVARNVSIGLKIGF